MTIAKPPEPETERATPAHYSNLDAVLESAWALLKDGAKNRHAAAHTPTLTTIGLDGAPRIRTFVLQGFEQHPCALRLHTDQRSTKISELRAHAGAALHIYDPEKKVQLQIDCRAELHIDDAVVANAWADTKPMSRIVYQVTEAPGTPIDDPLQAIRDPDETDGGAANFMVVTLQIEALEWLFLDARGHRRARFIRDGETWTGSWLVP